jgi:peptidoglycan-associated lipoprotein
MSARALAVLLGTLLLAGCAGTRAGKAGKKDAKGAAGGDASAAPAAPGAEAFEASLRGKTFIPYEGLRPVHFDYDQAGLSEEALAALKANAAWLKSRSDVEAQVQGHCDERGTTAYNLALGQKRARAVRDYYRSLGIPLSRISTISYGEEKPACAESSEDCWRRNRRAETLVRAR